MASKKIEAVKTLYLNWGAAGAANPEMSLEKRRDMIEGWNVLAAEPGAVDYIETVAGGALAMWAIPKGCAEDRVVLCLHGGGFVTGSIYTHRKLYGHLAKTIGARALILSYRRSPEHVHPAPVEDVVAAYSWSLGEWIKPGHIVFAGDSAGGGLAITRQLLARQRALPAPAASMLLSPWEDMEVVASALSASSRRAALPARLFWS